MIVNGKVFGFFHSLRGLKQGDPLSPTLFITVAEVLARSLNKLKEDEKFIGFGMPKWSESINHLSYADDAILFCSGHKGSVKKMMRVLQDYEKVFGHLINLSKSYIYVYEKISMADKHKLWTLTGIVIGNFPFTYLGCLIFYERKKKIYFEEIINKIAKRILA